MPANLNTRLEFVGAASPTTIAGGTLLIAGTSFSLTSATGYPTGAIGNFVLIINALGATPEKVLCTTRSGTTVTIGVRAYDGTTAAAHLAGESVQVCYPASEADAVNFHTSSAAAVHGVVGNVVGTSDAQTLTNKTIDATANTVLNFTGLLAVTDNSGSYTAATTAFALVDTVYQTVSFTAPASGRVLIRTSCAAVATNTTSALALAYWAHGTTTPVVGNTLPVIYSGGLTGGHYSTAQLLTGLSGPYQLDLISKILSPGTTSPTFSDLCIEVWAA